MAEKPKHSYLEKAVADGHARITGEGKSERIHYIAADHTERVRDEKIDDVARAIQARLRVINLDVGNKACFTQEAEHVVLVLLHRGGLQRRLYGRASSVGTPTVYVNARNKLGVIRQSRSWQDIRQKRFSAPSVAVSGNHGLANPEAEG